MLTYDLTGSKESLYKQIYENIRRDIRSGKLTAHAKIPSKRALAQNLSVSIITIEHAYDQLVSEGYLYALPRKGYYVSDIGNLAASSLNIDNPGAGNHGNEHNSQTNSFRTGNIHLPENKDPSWFDFSSNRAEREYFPFSVWARLMRETISLREQDLLKKPPCSGVPELRQAITDHLASFRGMRVDPDQIVVGAGTEYLYSLLVKLLGNDRVYCIENPGYRKLMKIYVSNRVKCTFAGMDDKGIRVDQLSKTGASVAHISPTHHFPTGITMPAGRRHELLAWAGQEPGRYIIEDDYDSEFRLDGKPIPALAGIDDGEKVIYMNTFSKSLASTIRISYMVLPPHLANRFYDRLSFYSCTVSTFEQYTLSEFISRGYFEKHINRMRRYYRRKREEILQVIQDVFSREECMILEKNSGLHMILQFRTRRPDRELKALLEKKGIRIATISDYDMLENPSDTHQFLLNYSNIDIGGLEQALQTIKEFL